MDPDDELDDDGRAAGWVHPDDRLWRHPSEVAGTQWPVVPPAPAPPMPEGPARRAGDPSLWGVAALGGLIGALLASGILTASGGLRRPTTTVVHPVEQVVVRASTVAAELGSSDGGVVAIAQHLRPTIVELDVDGNHGKASGSGVLFRNDGEILTNNHVVDGASAVQAIMSDGRRLPAHVVGGDADTDIAVVKIDVDGVYPVAPLGTAQDLKAGQQAVAIGSPLGLVGGPSVSVGVVSALGRQVQPRDGGTPLLDMIQTDAPIASGSSGGALLDSTGAVIGITTAIAVGDNGTQGLGFATPIDIAKDTAEQLIATGKVVHVWIGVEGDDIDSATAAQLSINGGAMVKKVRSGTPAAGAGIAVRDIIVRVDNQSVGSMGALIVSLRTRKPGDKVNLGYIRDGQWHTVQVTVVQRPKNP